VLQHVLVDTYKTYGNFINILQAYGYTTTVNKNIKLIINVNWHIKIILAVAVWTQSVSFTSKVNEKEKLHHGLQTIMTQNTYSGSLSIKLSYIWDIM